MISLLIKEKRFDEALYLGAFCIGCFSLSMFRYMYTDSKMYIFLNWNLFLAFIPWAVTTFLHIKPHLKSSLWVVGGSYMLWFLFFPNSPYILTDLFHLRSFSLMPIWFDLVLVLAYAWTGLLFGFLSLWDIEKILNKFISAGWVRFISIMSLFIGSFGIYIGRYLRWNSWDVVTEPHSIMYDVGSRVANPFDHPRTWGMTILMGIFLNMIYWSFRFIKKRNNVAE